MDLEVNTVDLHGYDALVRRVFYIEDVTTGSQKENYIVRYRGRLIMEDTAAAYDQLAAALKPFNVMPLFRKEGDRHMIAIVPALPEPKPTKPLVNLILFVLTFFSMLLTGAFYSLQQPLPSNVLEAAGMIVSRGWPFAVSMAAILSAHEMGHYLAGRYHRVNVTLPYFIPLPFSFFGTMGAFISMREPPRNRRQLLDIGIAGPLAGLIVTIPVLLLGLSLSVVDTLPTAAPPGQSFQVEGNSIVYLLSKFAIFERLLPAPATYGGLAPALYWLTYFFTGQPLPLGGTDVLLDQVAWAGWAGLLVTGLNLIPAGQLDGGHMVYVLLGKTGARRVFPFVLGGLALLGIVWFGWWLWVMIIFFLGRTYAEPLDLITPLDPRRRALAVLALILFVLTFTPVPLTLF